MLTLAPWLLAMAVLLALSAFFSASEAALFSLRVSEQTDSIHPNGLLGSGCLRDSSNVVHGRPHCLTR